jgi:hypothetical protein
MISNRSAAVLVAVVIFVAAITHQRQGKSIANDQSIADGRVHHIILDCMDHLKAYPMNKGLTRKDFASIVDSLSHSETGEEYSNLPLGYSLVFNMNACLNSKDCIGDHVTISITSQAEKEFFCLSITPLLVEKSMCTSDNKTSSAQPFETNTEL